MKIGTRLAILVAMFISLLVGTGVYGLYALGNSAAALDDTNVLSRAEN